MKDDKIALLKQALRLVREMVREHGMTVFLGAYDPESKVYQTYVDFGDEEDEDIALLLAIMFEDDAELLKIAHVKALIGEPAKYFDSEGDVDQYLDQLDDEDDEDDDEGGEPDGEDVPEDPRTPAASQALHYN